MHFVIKIYLINVELLWWTCVQDPYIKNMLWNKTIIFIFEMHIFPKAANSTTPSLHIWLPKTSDIFGYTSFQIHLATQLIKFIWLYPTIQIHLATQLIKFILLYPTIQIHLATQLFKSNWLTSSSNFLATLPPCYKIGFLLACSSLATLLEVLYLAFLSHHYG